MKKTFLFALITAALAGCSNPSEPAAPPIIPEVTIVETAPASSVTASAAIEPTPQTSTPLGGERTAVITPAQTPAAAHRTGPVDLRRYTER